MIFLGIISHFSCFCFLLLSLRVQEQKISLQVKCLIHNSAWHCILLKRSYSCLDAWSENTVVMTMKFPHGVFLAASNRVGLTCSFVHSFFLSFFLSFSLFLNFQKDFGCLLFFVLSWSAITMAMCLYLLNILILHFWLLEI